MTPTIFSGNSELFHRGLIMKKLLLCSLILIAVLIGCNPRPKSVYHPTADTQQKQEDLAKCKYEAEKSVAAWSDTSFPGMYMKAQQRDKIFILCLESKGYVFEY